MYVGKTYNFEKRRREHELDKRQDIPFHRALRKYGLENFGWEVIDTAKTEKEIIEKEIYWIKKLNTCIHSKNSNGYNITLGGEGGVSWNSRPVVQFDLQGKYINEYVSCAHAATETGAARHGIDNCANGKSYIAGGFQWKFKDEWNGKNIEPFKKRKSKKNINIIQLDLDGYLVNVFESVTEASKKTNTSRTAISGCLGSGKGTANGYQWIYFGDYNPTKDYKYLGVLRGKGIYQLDGDMNIIKHYRNCSEAARALGESDELHKLIHRRLKENKKCRGYYWRKVEDYEKQYGNTEVI